MQLRPDLSNARRAQRPFLLILPMLCLCVGVALSQTTGDAGTATAADAAEAVPAQETLWTLLQKGGWLMVPIVLCSLVALTVTIERLISLRATRTAPKGLLTKIFERLPTGDLGEARRKEAAELCDISDSVLGRILKPGVQRIHKGPRPTEKVVGESLAKEFHRLKRRIRPLSTVASVAPLLGLLGTIYGMIECFEQAGSADSSQRSETLANGIYAALVTTASGLTIAIPSYLLYQYFVGRVDRTVDLCEERATEFLEHYDESGANSSGDGGGRRMKKRSSGGQSGGSKKRRTGPQPIQVTRSQPIAEDGEAVDPDGRPLES